MRNSYKILATIILLAAIVLIGIKFFSFSGSTIVNAPSLPSSSATAISSTTENPSSAQNVLALATSTKITKYEPSQPVSSTPTKEGSCWTNSIAAPFRGDAWRCSIGNSIEDPCFQIPGSAALLCGVNPAKPNATSTFVLKLTSALPQSDPVKGLQPEGQAWLVELQGGTFCSPFTGTLPFTATGDVASYGCAPGALGKDVDIFNINSSSSLWMADIGTLTSVTSSLPTITASSSVPIIAVWE